MVCLSFGPMLATQHCLHAFWVLTSLHLLSFLLRIFFYYSLLIQVITSCKDSIVAILHIQIICTYTNHTLLTGTPELRTAAAVPTDLSLTVATPLIKQKYTSLNCACASHVLSHVNP